MSSRLLVLFILISSFTVSCKLGDNKLHGSFLDNEDTEPTPVMPIELDFSPLDLGVGLKSSIQISGGTPPYTYSILSGPATINPTTGEITTLFELGTVNGRVTDSNGNSVDFSFENTQALLNPTFTAGPGVYYYSNPLVVQNHHLENNQLIYRGDFDNSGVYHIYNAQIGGNNIYQLSTPGLLSVNQIFEFNYDKSKILYVGAPSVTADKRLFSVNLDGTGTTEVNDNLGVGRTMIVFKPSPIDNKVFYTADQDTDDVFELYSVTLGSTSSTKIATASGDTDIQTFLISPDGQKIVYKTYNPTTTKSDIYSVSTAGGASTKLNNPMAGNDTTLYKITNNSQHIIYTAEELQSSRTEFYSASIGVAASSVRLHNAASGDCYSNFFDVTSDSKYVIMYCKFSSPSYMELAVAEVGVANSAVKVNGTSLSGFYSGLSAYFSMDEQYVYYTNDETVLGQYDLFSFELSDPVGTKVKLNAANTNFGSVLVEIPGTNEILKLTGTAVYKSTLGIAGDTNIPIPTGQASRGITSILVSGDGQKVIILMDHEIDGVDELYSMKLDGSEFKKISNTMSHAGGDVSEIKLTPDGNKVIYRADDLVDGRLQLYCTAP